jgi:hypothetical protein
MTWLGLARVSQMVTVLADHGEIDVVKVPDLLVGWLQLSNCVL